MVDEGQRILAELRAYDWVDPEVTYEQVKEGLSADRPIALILARDRHQANVGVFFTAAEGRLLARLRELAAPPQPVPPASGPPAVAIERIVADVRRTTGLDLALSLRWEDDGAGGLWVCEVELDGRRCGSTHVAEPEGDEDTEEALADLADRLCESFLHEEIWGGWPLCLRHSTRPMWATYEDGRAWWVCEADPADRVVVGQLRLVVTAD